MTRLIIAVCIILSACCSTPKASNTLRIAFNTFPLTVDPRKSGDFVSSTLICLVYDGLTRCQADGSPEFAIADQVDISPDKTVYLFHLRDASWTDGRPVTAYDFEASWKKIIDPHFPSICTYLFYSIKNCEAAAKGQRPLSDVAIQALDDKTLRVELERPTPYFLSLTSFPSFLPVPSHLTEAELEQPMQVVTNGPFRIGRMIANSEIDLVKNEAFWNKEAIKLQGIKISIVLNEATALQMFEQDEIDWLGGPFSPILPDAHESIRKKQELHFFPMAASTFCSFNTTRSPFNNGKIRKAFSLAINRIEIVEKVTQLGQKPATRYIPPNLMNNEEKELYPVYDPVLARIYLEQGLKELHLTKLPTLTFMCRTSLIDKQIGQTLQRQWKDVLDVDIELEQTDFKTHHDKLHRRCYDFSLSYWIAQFSDPINILERFKDRDNPKNYPAWENPFFTKLLESAISATTPQLRLQIIQAAEAFMADEMPIAPIYHWSNPSLCHERLHNISTTPSGGVLFEKCWIEEPSKKIR